MPQKAPETLDRNDLAHDLHAANADDLDRHIMNMALRQTQTTHGALFAWDPSVKALRLTHHVVDNVIVTLPNRVLSRDSNRAGIALYSFENNQAYLCANTADDPRYTRYLSDVGSIAAVPMLWQERPIGVITVSAKKRNAFSESILETLARIASVAAPFVRRADLDRDSRRRTGRPFLIKGLSEEWRNVETRIELASPTTAPILVRGESGTGKDLVSRAIHFNSKRANKAYITVNCAAIPENLIESTLFGHRKGSFTGATENKMGEFHKADGGTLFLDEVGELPLALQAKVLRAVEQGEVTPIGSNQAPEHVDVRLVCATNRDLLAMSQQGQFREDLYYRLSVMTLELPALRTYKDNIEVLASVFLEQASRRFDKATPRIGPATMSLLKAYQYPGNVRELRNAIEHALILATGETIKPSHLPPVFRGQNERTMSSNASQKKRLVTLREKREEWLAPLEKQYLEQLLKSHGGNVRAASKTAGISTVTMYKLLRKREIVVSKEVRFE